LLGNGDGSFQEVIHYDASTNPRVGMIADFNSDGNLDLAFANFQDGQQNNSLSLQLGNGDGTFKTEVRYVVGTNPSGLAAGDIDGDGELDLVTANYTSNNASVLLGRGDGTFQSHVDYEAGSNPAQLAIGDFNTDGKLDIVTANDVSTVSVLLQTTETTLSLTSAASRKKHGNAGPFDIDLPLTGTPGVECRVGNGGTFLQTIVFTFSEDVTSISGASTTTCGRVDSTTISGSTVTVELGHVTCDGSDITVTVPGVNGASGSVDASVTMTLRTGDVNADGRVGTADLMEIRMNVGRGLVNDDNFRDDITVDGKVNHGDTTLEKSKL